MPPVNSPSMTSPDTRSPTSPRSPIQQERPLTPLSYLSSPVPDLASTLYTQAAEEADEANVSFLRNSIDSQEQDQPQQGSQTSRRSHVDTHRDPRRNAAQSPSHSNGEPTTTAQRGQESAADLSRRERLQRVLARLNRLHDPAASSSTAASYSNRTPSPHQQNLYDWAPAYDENSATTNNEEEDDELDAILDQLRRQQPNTHPDILRILSQTQLTGRERQRQREGNGTPAPASMADTAERRERLRERERRRRETEWVSLRTRAALQRSRQEGSPSATDRMLRYVMERERSGLSEEEERARGTGWFRPSPNRAEHRSVPADRDSWLLPPPASDARDQQERDRQERVEAFRRGYLAENAPPRLPRITTPPVPTVTSNSTPSPFLFMENALKYLSELRLATTYEDALSTAIDHGLATKEFFADKHDDFITDLQEVEPLPFSSWLQPGSVFEGHQHATNGTAGLTHRSAQAHVVEQINPNFRNANGRSSLRGNASGFDHPPGSTRVVPFDATRPWLSHQFVPPATFQNASGNSKTLPAIDHDQWPVRVIVHSIDPDTMTMQGTMEAYDVPQHPASLSIASSSARPKAGRKNAPITTYLEGHIIDLSTHSFLTPTHTSHDKKDTTATSGTSTAPRQQPSGPHPTTPANSTPYTTLPQHIAFPSACPSTDAANWQKLPPFSSHASPDDSARLMLSRARMQDAHEKYVFMRWKERCFVHSKDDQCSEADRMGDQDRGHGLTISGFYYVSLRRSDGFVEGLYFDPTSTPYQHLRLKGSGKGWPSYQFR